MKKLEKLIEARKKITQRHNELYRKDKKTHDLKFKERMKEYNDNRDLIIKFLDKNFDKLPVDIILEALSQLGQDNSVIYDDEGNWAISQTNFSSVRLKKSLDYEFHGFIESKCFKSTIRKALRYFLNQYIKNK